MKDVNIKYLKGNFSMDICHCFNLKSVKDVVYCDSLVQQFLWIKLFKYRQLTVFNSHQTVKTVKIQLKTSIDSPNLGWTWHTIYFVTSFKQLSTAVTFSCQLQLHIYEHSCKQLLILTLSICSKLSTAYFDDYFKQIVVIAVNSC